MRIDDFEVLNVRSMITDLGEHRVREVINKFSCPLNLEVENFLKKNAINFTKKSQSVTYLKLKIS